MHRHADRFAIEVHGGHQRPFVGHGGFLFDQRGERHRLPDAEPAALRRLLQPLVEDPLERADHLGHQQRSRRLAPQRIGVGEEIPFEIAGVRVEIANQRDVGRGLFELGRLAEARLFVDPSHLRNRQPLAERDQPPVHVAARDLVHYLHGTHRAVEPVLTRLELARTTADPQGGAKRVRIAHDASIHQPLADGRRAIATADLDELLGRGVPLEGFVHAVEAEIGGAQDECGEESQKENQADQKAHHRGWPSR